MIGKLHCVKSDRIRSYSGPHFPAFGLNTPYNSNIVRTIRTECSVSLRTVRMLENADQNNSEYGHFSRSVPFFMIFLIYHIVNV